MKKVTALLLSSFLILFLSGCQERPRISESMYSEITGLHYQELDGFKATVVERGFITSPSVLEWLDSIELSNNESGYYQYIYSDPDSWDMFLFVPNSEVESGRYVSTESMRFTIVDNIIKIYFDTTEVGPGASIIVLVQAPMRGVWPNGSSINVANKMIPQISADSST